MQYDRGWTNIFKSNDDLEMYYFDFEILSHIIRNQNSYITKEKEVL